MCLLAIPLIAADSATAKKHVGPVFVALDSWVYPVLTRLAAMGYAPDAEALAKPWTREQCVMLVEEVEDIASRHSTKISAGATNNEALRLIAELKSEFPEETHAAAEARIESLYTRLTQIAGQPLRDSYHFGQTVVDDFGRPYGQGTNTINGFSASGVWGRWSGYFRGEYQNALSRRASIKGGVEPGPRGRLPAHARTWIPRICTRRGDAEAASGRPQSRGRVRDG